MDRLNRQLVLRERPSGEVAPEHFSLVTAAVPAVKEGEVLVRVVWLGIDATQRTWLNAGHTYMPPVALGEVMRGSGAGQVIASGSDQFAVGDWVVGTMGWQEYCLTRADVPFALTKVPEGVDPKAMLGVLGVNGLTAYFGLIKAGQPTPGQTVFVSAAAGITGSIAGQIAKILGCCTIGSAGGRHKCDWVVDAAGFDACVDYKSENVSDRLNTLAPEGIDVVFDNVGGKILEAALDHLAMRARVVLCGSISSGYLAEDYGHGPRNYMQLAFKRARMEGFIFLDYVANFPQAFVALATWIHEGRIVYKESIVEGLESAPAALRGLFRGENIGKTLVHLVSE